MSPPKAFRKSLREHDRVGGRSKPRADDRGEPEAMGQIQCVTLAVGIEGIGKRLGEGGQEQPDEFGRRLDRRWSEADPSHRALIGGSRE